MICNAARGELEAAREVLAISERELQRVKQKGCEVATSSDRRVFQVPNYKALPWPVVTGPDITLEHDPNNKDLGRASINAAEFAEPFVGGSGSLDRVLHKPAYNAPGTDFAGSANLVATEKASFVGSELPQPPLYQQLASQIRMDLHGAVPPGRETAPAAMAQSQLGTTLGTLEPEQVEATRPLGRNVGIYGSSATSTLIQTPPFGARLSRAVKGAIYDCLHLDDITEAHLSAVGCSSKVTYVGLRDGRGPYLALLVLAAALVAVLLCRLLFRR
jgi:hypothetical protein